NATKSIHLRVSLKKNKIPVPKGGYFLDGKMIPTTSEGKCLGVTFSSSMSWRDHVDSIISKAYQRLHAINSLFPKKCGAVKQMLWNSLALPVLQYCCTVWNSAKIGHQRDLEKVQKDFLKSIRLGYDHEQHDPDFIRYIQHLNETAWNPLWWKRCKNILIVAGKAINNTLPLGHQILKIQSDNSTRCTRDRSMATRRP